MIFPFDKKFRKQKHRGSFIWFQPTSNILQRHHIIYNNTHAHSLMRHIRHDNTPVLSLMYQNRHDNTLAHSLRYHIRENNTPVHSLVYQNRYDNTPVQFLRCYIRHDKTPDIANKEKKRINRFYIDDFDFTNKDSQKGYFCKREVILNSLMNERGN